MTIKKHHWHEVFVTQSIIEVIAVLRDSGVDVDYNENIDPPGLAMGYIENNGGVILSCDIWRKEQSGYAMLKSGKSVKTSIELQGSNENFHKLIEIIKKTLTVVEIVI